MPTAHASWSGAAVPTVTKSWIFWIPSVSGAGATIVPIRHPVTLYVFDIPLMVTVRSARERRQRNVLALVEDVLVDLVGDGDEVVLEADVRHDLEIFTSEHPSRGVVRRVDHDGARLRRDQASAVVGRRGEP